MSRRKLINIELKRVSEEEYKFLPPSGICVVLDNIRSSHNVGSAFRSSDSFKVDKIWLCGICSTPPSAEIHKSALGAENSVEWEWREDSLKLVEELKREGYKILCIEQTTNSTSLEKLKIDKNQKYALVFGNEVDGVRQEIVDMCDESVEIPQFGSKHSLNVSVAIGIVLWQIKTLKH